MSIPNICFKISHSHSTHPSNPTPPTTSSLKTIEI
jgi:hypothetical protein